MIAVMREKLGKVFIGSVVGLIAFVFIFYGIFMPGQGGGGGPGVAGEVNGEPITYSEFSRALNQRVEYFKSMMGGKITDEQLAQFKIREAVFQDLTQRKLLLQMAKKEGFGPAAEVVRERILSMDAFKKDGRFDKVQYKAVLAQNNYTVARFEDLVSQEVTEQLFRDFLSSMATVTDLEVEADLKKSREKRKLRYVFLDHEVVRKSLKPIEPAKNVTDDQLKAKVDSLVSQVTGAVTSGNKSAVEQTLKAYSFKMNTSDWLTSQADYLSGVGSIRQAQQELFSLPKGSTAKRVSILGGTLVATVADAEVYDPKKITPKDRTETAQRLRSGKNAELAGELMKAWTKEAKITRNDDVVVGGKGAAMPVTIDQ